MEEIIHEHSVKDKSWTRVLGVIAMLVLSSGASFAAGILIVREGSHVPIKVYEPKPIATTTPTEVVLPVDPTVIASKTGTKYYFPWCSGAKRIATSSKVTFKSKELAEKAGYTPAANCKGLK